MLKKQSFIKVLGCILIVASLGFLVNPPKGIAQDSTKKQETKNSSLKTPPNSEKPTEVSVGIYLTNLARVDQVNETFDVQGFLYVKWKDERLAFQPEYANEIRHPKLEDIWQPSLGIVNAPIKQKNGHMEINVEPNGNVTYVEQFNTTISSDLNLKHFPFDSQTVHIYLEPWTGGTKEITLVPDNQVNNWSKESYTSLSEWDIQVLKTAVKPMMFTPEQKEYSRFIYSITLKRHYGFYIWKVIVPMLLIVGISWGVFWINPKEAFPSQLSLGMTSMLSTITLNITVSASLPRVSYLMLLDGFIVSSYIFVFLAIVAIVAIHFLLKTDKTNTALKLHNSSKYIFPSSFGLINLILLAFFWFI